MTPAEVLNAETRSCGDWERHVVCPCGWHTYAPFSSVFHTHIECCPKCGESNKSDWEVKTMRFVVARSGVWWNPFSWNRRTFWETK